MAISIVQFRGFPAATAGNFLSNVSPGNSIILFTMGYNTSGNIITSANPQYNGAPVTGASELFALQSAGTVPMFAAIWLLPGVSGSGTSVSFTLTNSNIDTSMGFAIAEAAGLGAAPALDSTAPNPSTRSNNAGGVFTSGSTGNIIGSPDLIVGAAMNDNSGTTGPAAPWTNLNPSTAGGFAWAGYQIATTPGAGYTFAPSSGAGRWAAGVAAIKTGGTPPPPAISARNITPADRGSSLKKIILLGW